MLGKVWNKVLLFVLIVECVFKVMIKLIKRTPLKNEIESTIKYVKGNKVEENIIQNNVKTNSKLHNQPEGTEEDSIFDILERNNRLEEQRMTIETN